VPLSLEQHRKSELMLKLMLEIEKIKLLGLINCLFMFRRIISPINLCGAIYEFLDWPQHDTITTNIKLPCLGDGTAECAESHAINSQLLLSLFRDKGMCCDLCDLSQNGRFTKTVHVHQVVCQARQNLQTKCHKTCFFSAD